MKLFTRLTALSLLLTFTLTATAAEMVEKWVDEQGVTHYTDKASVPEGISSETVVLPEPATPTGEGESTAERLKKQADALEKERKARAAEAGAAEDARALEEAQQRGELVAEPPKKKKKKRRSEPRPPPPPPPEPPKKSPPTFKSPGS